MVISVWLCLCLFISVLCKGPQCVVVAVSPHLSSVLWSSVCDCVCVSSSRCCVMVLSVWLCLFISVLCNGPQCVYIGCVSSSQCCVMVLSVWFWLCLFISVLCYGPQCGPQSVMVAFYGHTHQWFLQSSSCGKKTWLLISLFSCSHLPYYALCLFQTRQ